MSGVIAGRAASEGLVLGPAVVLAFADVPDDLPTTHDFAAVAAETAARLAAVGAQARSDGRDEEADVLDAYALIAVDPALARSVASRTADGEPLVAAVRASVDEAAEVFAGMDDEYFRQRADDVRGVGRELIATLAGVAGPSVAVPEGAVVCAVDLTPADTVRLDLARVGGLATEQGGPTSHTAIVARAAGIPAVVGAAGLLDALAATGAAVAGAPVILVDGDRGEVVIDPDAGTIGDVERRIESARTLGVEQQAYRGRPVRFAGERILVAANVGGTSDLAAAVGAMADGIGLFRSEFLFLERASAPGREEQAAAYRAAVDAFEDPTVVRTLDIGGDKDVAYLDLPREENPFLGVRGLRLCLENLDLFDVQLDALLDVDGRGRLRIMFPMVSSVADLDAGAARLAERARRASVAPPPLGIMVETPAAALLASHLARRADFFSIGTNDLVQYVTAADRTNGRLGAHQDPANPAALRLVDLTCRGARSAGIPVAVCGEAAGDPAVAAVLLGLGVTELSVAASRIDRVRWSIDQLDADRVQRAAREALALPDADAVREHIAPLLP